MAKSTVDAMNAGGQPGDVPVFYPSPRSNRSTRTILIDSVADVLIERAIGDADFFADLDQAMRRKGYRLSAQQRGIQGSYITVEKIDGNSTEV